MKNEKLEILKDTLDIIGKHFDQIDFVDSKIGHLFPLTTKKMKNMTRGEQVDCDVLIYRFTHLQDTIATKAFPLVLEVGQEQIDELFFIDRLNLLERRGIIEKAYQWQDLRDLRNKLSHEYVNQPEHQVKLINQVWQSLPIIRACVERIKQRVALFSL